MSAVDKSLRLDLTDLEKQMLDTQHVIEVRGKELQLFIFTWYKITTQVTFFYLFLSVMQ